MLTQHQIVPAIQWYEGMLLSPQHFQQQELRWQQIISAHLTHLSPYHWGIINLKFDPVTLPTGLLRILTLDAIMPDGLVVSHQAAPDGFQLQIDLSSAKQNIIETGATIYLCIPEHQEGISPITGEMPRYRAIEGNTIPDENSIDNIIQIPRLLPKMSLMMSEHEPARYTSFPIAKIGFLDESFILKPFEPPCFKITRTSLIGEKSGSLARRLREKSAYLSEKWQAQLGTALIGETTSQMRPLVQSLPILEPLVMSDKAHPFELYKALCHVAGLVSTLRLGQIPPLFPVYNHNNLLPTFQALFDWINIIIDSIEKAYSILLFAHHERLFTIMLQPEIFTKKIIVGLKAPSTMTEKELEDWMRDAIITTESHFESARIRRITGAHRTLAGQEELNDLMPGRGVLIFKIDADHNFMSQGERLLIVNPADTPEKRPTEVVLYLKHADINPKKKHNQAKYQHHQNKTEGHS